MSNDNELRSKSIQKITIFGAVIDFILAVIKIVVGKIGGSVALVADGVHSFSDLVSDAIVLYASKHSSEDPDEDHPYGHDRFETIATLFLGVILLLVGIGIIYDALWRFSEPVVLSNTYLLISVAIISIISKEGLFWATIKVAKEHNSEMLKANAWHHRSDAISSVVVLIGILGAWYGVGYLDLVAALIVGAMIIKISLEFCFDSTKELVDTGIEKDDLNRLKKEMLAISGVSSVHSLRTRNFGSSIYCDVHVEVMPFLSVSEGHLISVLVEGKAKECLEGLSDITVHIDPEETDHHVAYQELLPRESVVSLIDTLTENHHFHSFIIEKRLHYLDGVIHVDFIVDSKVISNGHGFGEVETYLNKILIDDNRFGIIRVYYFNE